MIIIHQLYIEWSFAFYSNKVLPTQSIIAASFCSLGATWLSLSLSVSLPTNPVSRLKCTTGSWSSSPPCTQLLRAKTRSRFLSRLLRRSVWTSDGGTAALNCTGRSRRRPQLIAAQSSPTLNPAKRGVGVNVRADGDIQETTTTTTV